MIVKRIAAIIAIILLLALYIVTLIAAIFSKPEAPSLFVACAWATIIIPIMLYVFLMTTRFLKGRGVDQEASESKKHPL